MQGTLLRWQFLRHVHVHTHTHTLLCYLFTLFFCFLYTLLLNTNCMVWLEWQSIGDWPFDRPIDLLWTVRYRSLHTHLMSCARQQHLILFVFKTYCIQFHLLLASVQAVKRKIPTAVALSMEVRTSPQNQNKNYPCEDKNCSNSIDNQLKMIRR